MGLVDVVALFKLRIGGAITLSAIAGATVAAGGWPGVVDFLVLAVGVLLAASGAGACNHWFEHDLDRLMARTARRPFASGRLEATPRWLWLFGGMIVGGALLVAFNSGATAGALVAAGAATYALLYTMLLKRRTDWNIVIGGAAGSFAVLAGAATVGPGFSIETICLALVLFLWTPSHFWSLAIALTDDYQRAGVPMLPVTRGIGVAARWNLVNTGLLVSATLAFAALVASPWLWSAAIAGSAWLMVTTVGMVLRPSRRNAMRAFHASLIQLGSLLVGIFAALPPS